MLREMATTYGRSPGGYVWAVLEPVAGITLLTLVFSVAFRAPALGSSFPQFYATGMVPFLLFSGLTAKLAQSLNFSKPLLAYPAVTWLDALLARFVLNLMTELLVGYIVFSGIQILFDTRVIPDYTVIFQAYLMVATLALGIGTLNCFLVSRFTVYQQIWSIAMRPMFLLSGIFFLLGSIPQPYRDWLWWNPLIHVVGLMRRGFYPSYDAAYVSQFYVYGLSLTCLTLGLVLLRRFHRELLHR